MNKTNMIKLLSVLLFVATLFVGCAPAGTDTNGAQTTAATTEEVLINKESKHEAVEAKLENFFALTYQKPWGELGEATRVEGTLVAQSDNLLVIRKADIDHLNTVTEIFTVYNTELKREVLSVQNQYQNGSYTAFDWNNLFVTDEDVKYPSSVMRVSLEEPGESEITVIRVAKAKITPIEEEVREENPDACFYTIETSYEYYDIAGKKIADSKRSEFADAYLSGWETTNEVSFTLGGIYVTFSLETGEMVRVFNRDTDQIVAGYDFENDRYGYFLNQTHEGAAGVSIPFIEVYSKATGNCICRHYIENAASINSFVLEDGDVLLQVANIALSDTNQIPDLTMLDVSFFVDHYILDVETGNVQTLELDYLIQDLIPRGSARFEEELSKFGPTEHVVNYATVITMKNQSPCEMKILVLDNDLTQLYDLGPIVPEHTIGQNPISGEFSLSVEPLVNGDLLVEIADVVATRAIVTKAGVVRSYLKNEVQVVGEYILLEDGIYDYDMKNLYDFSDSDYDFAFSIGNKLVVSKKETGGAEKEYYLLKRDGSGFDTERILEGKSILAQETDYLIVLDNETQKRTLYDAELEHVLTTANSMELYALEDSYLVRTQISLGGALISIFYTVPTTGETYVYDGK